MKEIIFLIGGCRSGKSNYALKLAERIDGNRNFFIATCEPRDDEMKERVKLHQKARSSAWTTIEAPIVLPEAITEHSDKSDVIVVDCLTIWISNLLLKNNDYEQINKNIQDLIQSLEQAQCPVIIVSNEVGTGIVPENFLARKFRDVAGLANQKVAASANEVILMTAGIAIKIK